MRIVLFQLFAIEWEEVIRGEESFAALGKILHRIRDCVRANVGRATVAETLFDTIVEALRFGFLESGFDLFIPETFREDSVVICVGQFVEREIWHPLRLTLEISDVREFDRFRHRGVAFIFTQPAGTGVILRARLYAGIFGRKPKRHLPQFRDGCCGNHSRDLLKLYSQKFKRPLSPGLVLFHQFVADEQGPTFDGLCLMP